MSRSIDRHRHRVASQRGDVVLDDELIGDADQTQMATGAIAELLANAGKMGAASQKAKEDKAKADKAKDDLTAATAAASKARKTADEALHQAQLDSMKAQAETNTAGPLHQVALMSAQKAQSLNAEAQKLEAAAGMGMAGGLGQMGMPAQKSEGFPTWGYFAIGGGVLGVGLIGWLALRKH